VSALVSVVMPAFQAERTIGAAVSSVLSQTYEELELVVVDDGSTDATAAIAEAHAGAGPVVLLRQENTGVAGARNAGIRAATGSLIAFCDADDIWFPQHLEALAATQARHGGIAAANSLWLFPGGVHPAKRRYTGRFPDPGDQRRTILEQNFVSTMSLFPRSLPDEIGFFREDLRRAEDWEFWMRAIFSGHRVALQPRPLALYRWSLEGLSSDHAAMTASVRTVLQEASRALPLSASEREYVEHRLASPDAAVVAREADAALRAGRFGEAARGYRLAASLCPSETKLVWKARVVGAAPRLVGPLVRARQLRIERDVDFPEA
jgi:GT2 family glycosyltransferase